MNDSPPPPPADQPPGSWPPPGPPSTQMPPLSQSDERLWSLLCHLSFFVLGVIAPLVIMLTLGTRSPYLRHQAVEALNFHLTVLIACVVSLVLTIVIVGIFLFIAVIVVGAVFAVIAAIQSYQGVMYRYPLTIRLVT